MSALPPKADMVQHNRDIRFVPEADMVDQSLGANAILVDRLRRQNEFKHRTSFLVRPRRKLTAMTVDNHPANRQSQSHSFRLCRNERIKYAV
jgi:hypothetical protein